VIGFATFSVCISLQGKIEVVKVAERKEEEEEEASGRERERERKTDQVRLNSRFPFHFSAAAPGRSISLRCARPFPSDLCALDGRGMTEREERKECEDSARLVDPRKSARKIQMPIADGISVAESTTAATAAATHHVSIPAGMSRFVDRLSG